MENKPNYEYHEVLSQLVAEIRNSRIVIAKRINQTVMEVYWTIGRDITEKRLVEGYGKGVVDKLSSDLQKEFPGYGFSPRNLWYMQQLYRTYYQADEKLQQAVAVLPWGHNILIMSKTGSLEEAQFYLNSAAEHGWSRNVLLHNIKANCYANSAILPKQNNFSLTLPEHLQEQAEEILKSRYNMAFLNIEGPLKEIELEKRLSNKIKDFILELGKGFTFIGNQYRLTLNRKEYFVDMLFFNRSMRCLVAIDLKMGDFKPEYIGKMNFYLNLLDRQVKMPDENPSIGIVLCASKDTMEVEIALHNICGPIAVADYNLNFPKDQIKQIITEELNRII